MGRLASFVTRRGKSVTIQEYTLGAATDANWEDEGERPVPSTPRTVKAVRETRGDPSLRRIESGEWSEWDAVFHVADGSEPMIPAGQTAATSGFRPEVTDEDGNVYTVEDVGREELGLRRLYCTRKR